MAWREGCLVRESISTKIQSEHSGNLKGRECGQKIESPMPMEFTQKMNRGFMRHEKFTPREDHRQREGQRVQESASLAEKFRELKSLTVEFGYFSPEGVSRNRQIKYTVNPTHAKSVFLLNCLNDDCVGGDFDLSEVLDRAIAKRQSTVTGELRCQGWLNHTTIDRLHCHTILRYKLSLAYGVRAPVEVAPVPVD